MLGFEDLGLGFADLGLGFEPRGKTLENEQASRNGFLLLYFDG